MCSEPDREVEDHADDGGSDRTQCAGESRVAAQAFDVGAPTKIQRTQGVKVTQVASSPPKAAASIDTEPDAKGFTEADAVTGISSCLGVTDVHYAFTLLVGQLWISPVASRHQR